MSSYRLVSFATAQGCCGEAQGEWMLFGLCNSRENERRTRSACSTFDYPTGAMMVQTALPFWILILSRYVQSVLAYKNDLMWYILFVKLYLSNLNLLHWDSFLLMIGKAAVCPRTISWRNRGRQCYNIQWCYRKDVRFIIATGEFLLQFAYEVHGPRTYWLWKVQVFGLHKPWTFEQKSSEDTPSPIWAWNQVNPSWSGWLFHYVS